MVLAVSVVSHGHATQLRKLLALLSRPGATPVQRVWLTLNLPEPELVAWTKQPWPFDLQLLINAHPKGFGANHNQAFAGELAMTDAAKWFAVLNPDLSWESDPFPALLATLEAPSVGCAFPLQLDSQGQVQDHLRTVPDPLALLRRHLSRRAPGKVARPEWVNAACLVFPRQVYEAVGGFDTRYFMYCEDVDLSLRLQLAGHTLVQVSAARVIHDASRASRHDLRHLAWHLSSLLRLWWSPVYRRYRARRASATIRV